MKTIIALAALTIAASHASAADLQLKALAATTTPSCTISYCTGFFAGGNIGNAGGNFDVLGTGLNGLATNGMLIGGQAGYEFWNGQIYASLQGILDWDFNLNSTVVPGISGLKQQITYGVIGSLGYSLASAFGLGATGTTQLTVPQQFLQSLMTPYVNVGIVRRHDQNALVSGAGLEALIATNWTLRADYYHFTYQGDSAASAIPGMAVSQNSDNLFLLSINRHWGS